HGVASVTPAGLDFRTGLFAGRQTPGFWRSRGRRDLCGGKMKKLLLLLAVASVIHADKRTQPPTITVVAPTGVMRGKTATIEIEGSRLEGASQIIFSDTAISGTIKSVKEVPQEEEKRTGTNSSIDLGDRPPKNQVIVEVTAAD